MSKNNWVSQVVPFCHPGWENTSIHDPKRPILDTKHSICDSKLKHKTCNILAAERLQLMIFDNRLIIDSLKAAHCSLLFSVVPEFRKEKQAFCDIRQ